MQESQVPLQKEEGYAKKHSPLPFVFFSSFQAPGLPVHILNQQLGVVSKFRHQFTSPHLTFLPLG